jgi:tetratricopeptide (TPR) repeat protein
VTPAPRAEQRTSCAAAVAVLAAMVFAAWAAPVRAEVSYGDANRAYQDGRYAEAVEHYEALVDRGIVHEDLYYNLGNAYFRVGQLGPAIYNYERALRVQPDFEDAVYNLRLARSAAFGDVLDRLEEAELDPPWIRAVTFASSGKLAIGLAALSFAFFGILLVIRLLASGLLRTALVVANAFTGVSLLACAVLLAGHIYFIERVSLGIVLDDEVVMREGADALRAARGRLYAGLRVHLLEREAGWLRVRLATGVEGWVPDASVGRL